MMLYKGFLLFLLAAPGDVASLSCYSCNNVDSLDSCKTITTCEKRESCFKRLQKKGQSASFTLGCTQNKNCGSIPVYTNVSKLSNGQLLQECEECCGVDQCNKDLCNHKTPPPCSDNMENCAFWNKDFDICEDIHKAKLHCRKFCKLCDLVDGNWADWSSWSSCDVTCGHGKHTRIRTCTNPAPAYKGLDCKGTNTDTKPCTRPLCPVHGGWAGWSSWESCPVTCDIGIQKRHRKCTNPSPLRHGNHCFGESMDVKLCKQKSCDDQIVTPTVAFKARLNAHTAAPVGQVIVFPTILFNEGDAYSSQTGKFTATTNGTYLFTIAFCVQKDKSFSVGIMVDGVSYSKTHIKEYAYVGCMTADTIAVLKAGQSVWVQPLSSSFGQIIGHYSDAWNTFSGTLLHK